jgi:drug/metabolite transporter (DMT)-like permease
MLRATVLALTAACLHATWNLVAKRSADRFLALWGQFFAASLIGVAVLLTFRSLPADAWGWAAICGLAHVPYLVGLSKAYDHGDFSVVYPIARGCGALLAALGGIWLLGDDLSAWSLVAIVVVAGGVCLLATSAGGSHGWGPLGWALLVSVSIGVYTTNDSHAARTVDGNLYPFAAFAVAGVCVTTYGVLAGRRADMVMAFRTEWPKFFATGITSTVTYVLVLLAVRTAPVGYVAALRESSVLIAALVGSRMLAEGNTRRRTFAAGVILAGLVLLVVTG